MIEQEWLSSDDPAAMLAALPHYGRGDRDSWMRSEAEPTPGRLRAWVEACRAAKSEAEGVPTIWTNLDNPRELAACVETWSGTDYHTRHVPMSGRAALLREVLGNPWRPVTLPSFRSYRCPAGCVFGSTARDDDVVPEFCRPSCGKRIVVERRPLPCPWLTPPALSLARLARDNPARPPLAPGQRYRSEVMAERNTVVGCCNAHADNTWCDCLARAVSDVPVIDPFRLAVLADALEEAGCDSADLLGHLRSDGPHVAACWALSLLLGEE